MSDEIKRFEFKLRKLKKEKRQRELDISNARKNEKRRRLNKLQEVATLKLFGIAPPPVIAQILEMPTNRVSNWWKRGKVSKLGFFKLMKVDLDKLDKLDFDKRYHYAVDKLKGFDTESLRPDLINLEI